MKESRIKRLIPKKLARELVLAGGDVPPQLARLVEREAEETIAKMRERGYSLATRLETGEGVFVRDNEIVPLHVQLPAELYRKLGAESQRREVSKKRVVVDALAAYFDDADE